MCTSKLSIYTLGQLGFGEVTGEQYSGSHLGVAKIILASVKVPPVPHTFQGKLADKTKGYTPFFQKVSEVTPKVAPCLYCEHNTAATGFNHLNSCFLQRFIEAIPGVREFKLGLDNKVFIYSDRSMFLFVRVNPHDKVSGWDLLEFPGCVILHLMAPPTLVFVLPRD
jgi:hypothetical protein